MLILTRRFSESIIIDRHIKVTVLGIRAGQVKIGISAPKSIPVNREEVQQRIDAEEGAPALFTR